MAVADNTRMPARARARYWLFHIIDLSNIDGKSQSGNIRAVPAAKHERKLHQAVNIPPDNKGLQLPDGTPCVQGMLIGCAGGFGGVAHGPALVVKSKNSLMSGIEASRAVRLGRWKRVSISLSAAVESIGVCETKFFFVNGEITINGTRNPVWVKSPGWKFGCKMGGIPSGLGTDTGGT